jgi:hypothetical protein
MSTETQDHQLHTMEEERAHRRAMDLQRALAISREPWGRDVLIEALVDSNWNEIKRLAAERAEKGKS